MARVTPEEYAEKQARRLKASVEDIRHGVEGVTTSPTAAAAGKQAKMLANVQESINSGRWAASLKAVSLDDWKGAMVEKGLPRISGGIDAAHDKVVKVAAKLLPIVDAAAAKVKGMPDLTLEDSIARASSFMREMAKAKGKVKA